MPYDPEADERHPSYGLLSFTRVNHSTDEPLFGASIDQRHSVMLEIQSASIHRSLSEDRYMNGEVLLTARLSASQFADAITNMNRGNGTPITIQFVAGDPQQRPPPPRRHIGELFVDEHRQSVDESLQLLDDIIAHPRLPAAARRKAQQARGHIQSSIPFMEQQFRRQIEQTMAEARASIENFAAERERLTGQAAMTSGAENNAPPQITTNTPEPPEK